jgi:molybdopterin molybdotransferase
MGEFLILKSGAEARAILGGFDPVEAETTTLEQALDRVLAEDLVASEDLPPSPRATMDGYALRARDVQGACESVPCYLKLVGAVAMGGVFPGRIAAGEAVGISTGGVLPEGADAVVMIEYVDRVRSNEIEVHRSVAAGDNVIRPGEDVARGEMVLASGKRLRPQDVGALAAFGRTEVRVFRRPIVAVLSTGNEIVAPEAMPGPGQVRDINQYALAAQVRRAGGDPLLGGIVADDADLLRARVSTLLDASDMVMLSGGSSVGVRDVAAEVLSSLGSPGVLFHGINVRPGKPTLCARIGRKPVLGMPGYPVSSMVIFDAFVRPLIWQLGGEAPGRDPWPGRRRARLSRRHASAPAREDWVRVRLETRSDGLWAVPVLGGSASLSTVIRADGLVRVDAGSEGIGEGDEVEVLLYH